LATDDVHILNKIDLALVSDWF